MHMTYEQLIKIRTVVLMISKPTYRYSETKNKHNIIYKQYMELEQEGAPSEDSDQPGHLLSLIRVFGVRSMGS